ncbi:MAG: hypothetical protein OEW35_04880 [Gammaproteobacteria bacterium]|nr:hypothetical protein [Gammaproteobacteria bacterium]
MAIFGLAYFGLGVSSALISNPLQSELGQASIRVGIFLVGIAVYVSHIRIELAGLPGRPRAAALLVALGVASGTFLLAVYAVSMALWETSRVGTALLAALVIWPVATGIPAFLVALLAGAIRARARSRGS